MDGKKKGILAGITAILVAVVAAAYAFLSSRNDRD